MSSFYSSPSGEDPLDEIGSPEQQKRLALSRIANQQRLVVGGFALHLAALTLVGVMFWQSIQPPRAVLTAGCVLLGSVFLFAGVAVFLTHRSLAHWRPAAFRAVLAAVPILGLLPIWLAIQAATQHLRENHVSVGPLGADPGQFR